MHFCRSLRWLCLPLIALATPSAVAQNLLVNPGFDRDLSGWLTSTSAQPPDNGQASVAWTASDASGSSTSGGVAFQATSEFGSAMASVTQCFSVTPGLLATMGAKILTTHSDPTSSASVAVSFFSSPDCSGIALGQASAKPDPAPYGVWSHTATFALASPAARSVRAELSATAYGTFFYGVGEVEAVADDATFTLAAVGTTTSILPSAAWIHGANGSYWTTQFTLCNPGPIDADVTLKWLGHDADGRGGLEFTYVVPAGQTFAPLEETWSINFPENWGAILVLSTSPALIVQGETSTPPSGGAVGQVVPAFGPADFAGATPKTLAPIRENAAFRTNLILANPTEMPLTAHVALYAAGGTLLGARDVDLLPLGMTQINRVAAALGASTLDLGRINVSTPTPGGLVAAYASVIDNVTNDPRTILPR